MQLQKTIKLSAILLSAAALLASCGQAPGGPYIPPYRFPYEGTGHDGYGLPDFGCSAEPIEGRLQPVRVSLAVRPVKK